jgi:hypothetical protein
MTVSARALFESPLLWRGAEMADPTAWTVCLTEAERDEVIATAERAERDGLTPSTLTKDTFALPGLATTFRRCADDLHTGPGFVLLRGFPTDRLTPGGIRLAYVGIGRHFGTPVCLDLSGSLLSDVRDKGVPRTGPGVRVSYTNLRQDFHTDQVDVVALLCLHPCRTGGQSQLVNARVVFNQMLARRPDLVEVLYEPFWWDRNDEQPPGQPPAYQLPVLRDVDGAPRFFYIGWYIRDAQRHSEIPRLTAAQVEAIDLLEAIANGPELRIGMDFQRGDIQLVDDARILHAREAYEDHDDPARRRHLLRLLLRRAAQAA